METRYFVVKSINDEGQEEFGIEIKHTIKGVSHNKERVQKLVKLCNRYGASIVHIFDIIDDFLDE